MNDCVAGEVALVLFIVDDDDVAVEGVMRSFLAKSGIQC